MDKLTLDFQTASTLKQYHNGVELTDPAGHVLGYFVPIPDAPAAACDDPAIYAWLRAQITDEEIERRREKPLGHTTAEVLAKLRSL